MAQVTVDSDLRSNLAKTGSSHATLNLDFTPGGTCNIVDETGAFVFDEGTIFTSSHHEDCATNGLRIDTTFRVTGGTGSFAGATGGGREFSAVNQGASLVTFNGTISF